jgi:hypothetical protein
MPGDLSTLWTANATRQRYVEKVGKSDTVKKWDNSEICRSKKSSGVGGMAQVVENLPNKHEAQSSDLISQKKRNYQE